MQGQCIDLPKDSVQAAGPPTTADGQSIFLRCLLTTVITKKVGVLPTPLPNLGMELWMIIRPKKIH